MAKKEPDPTPPPQPHFHARQALGSDALYPGLVTARLTLLTLDEWKELEQILLARGYKPY
jgi:hypothetical protein